MWHICNSDLIVQVDIVIILTYLGLGENHPNDQTGQTKPIRMMHQREKFVITYLIYGSVLYTECLLIYLWRQMIMYNLDIE